MTGPPESILDWTREIDSDLSNQNMNNQAFSRKLWRLLQCQNGKPILHTFFFPPFNFVTADHVIIWLFE